MEKSMENVTIFFHHMDIKHEYTWVSFCITERKGRE